MSRATDVSVLTAELAQLRAQLDEQAAELTALKAQPTPAPDGRVSRRHLITGLAGLGAAGVAGVAGAAPAAAADGQPLTLGQDNTSATTTRLTTTLGGADFYEFATELSSDAYATLAVAVNEDPDGAGGRAAIFADNTSTDSGAAGVLSFAKDGPAIEAINESDGFPTVGGVNRGPGPGLYGASWGGGAQLVLEQETGSTPGPPPSGQVGYIRLDSLGDLWVCTAAGTPGSWTRLLREDTARGRTVPIVPIRVLDTRAPNGRPGGSPVVPGQRSGPLKGGQELALDVAGFASPIPGSATGLVGNLTVVGASYGGYLSVMPGFTSSFTSAINFTKGVTVANAFTSKINTIGLGVRSSGTTANSYHLIVDITAYLT